MASKIKPLFAELDGSFLRFQQLKDYGDSFWVQYQKRMRPTRQAITVTNVKTKKPEIIEIADGAISSCLRMPLELKKWQERIVKIVTIYAFFRKKLDEAVVNTQSLKSVKCFSEEDFHRFAGAITTVLVFSKINPEEDVHVPRDVFKTATGFYLYATSESYKDCRVYMNMGAGELSQNGNEVQRPAYELVTGAICQKLSRRDFTEDDIETENQILNHLQNVPGIARLYHSTICDGVKFVQYQKFSSTKLLDRDFIGSLSTAGLVKIIGQLLHGLERMSQHGVHGRIHINSIGLALESDGYEAWIADFGNFQFLKKKRIRRGASDIEIIMGPSPRVRKKTLLSPKSSSLRSKSPDCASSNRVSSPVRRASSPSQHRRSRSRHDSIVRIASPTRAKSPASSQERSSNKKTSASRVSSPTTKAKSRVSSPAARVKSPPQHRKNHGVNKPDARVNHQMPGRFTHRSSISSVSSSDRRELSPAKGLDRSKVQQTPAKSSDVASHQKRTSDLPLATKPNGPVFLRASHTLSERNQSGPVFLKPSSNRLDLGDSPSPGPVFLKPQPRVNNAGPVFLTGKSIAKLSQIAPIKLAPTDEELKKKDVFDLGGVLKALLDAKQQIDSSGEEFKGSNTDDDQMMEQKTLAQLKAIIERMTSRNVEERCDAVEAYRLFQESFR